MNEIDKPSLFTANCNGKLLLSGEYLVLKGAKALAIPTIKGQSINIFDSETNELSWTAYHPNGIWNTVRFNDKLTIIDATHKKFAKQLQKILIAAIKLSDIQVKAILNKNIETHLEFMPEWGLGSSSTLIYLIAKYFKINPYELLAQTFKGSGYDIAIAQNGMPVFFLLVKKQPKSVAINFSPPFKENVHFLYLGEKMKSQKAVSSFNKIKVSHENISEASTISTLMAVCTDLSDFQKLMIDHENLIGKIIKETPIKNKLFNDFNGCIKSLGAWGGDFAMVATKEPFSYVQDYFKNKNLDILFKYNDMILKNPCHQ